MSESSELKMLVRQEWINFRSRGRLIAITVATLVVILLGLLAAASIRAFCSEGPVEVPCPTSPVGPHGQPVSDNFYFVHKPLGANGSITVRMTSMTGIITYPPPDHDEIVTGLVPWAKAGIIIKDGVAQGSSYAALMVTGSHGVRMQYDYIHDLPGRPFTQEPRWLRLTRSGDTITGYESADGTQWTKVGTANLPGLPGTVQVGLFATSPGDLTLQRIALGAGLPQVRFTQATGVFDNISVQGAAASEWSRGAVGEMGRTDWEKYHRAPGLVESDGTFTVTGSGDIGPVATEGVPTIASTLIGLGIGLIIMIVVAVRFATAGRRRPTGEVSLSGPILVAKAVVIAAVTFLIGLIAVGTVMPVGTKILRANGAPVLPISTLTGLRVIVGVAAVLAVAAVFALGAGALLRRRWVATSVAISTVALPYLIGVLPVLPDEVAKWLLRVTPAAGFAVQQTMREYPQVVNHYVPLSGYFPLPWWAGFAVLCGYAAAVLALAVFRSAASASRTRWR